MGKGEHEEPHSGHHGDGVIHNIVVQDVSCVAYVFIVVNVVVVVDLISAFVQLYTGRLQP